MSSLCFLFLLLIFIEATSNIIIILLYSASLAIYDNSIGGVMPPSICNLNLDNLAADCKEIYCGCCTKCCDTVECDATAEPTSSFKLPFTDGPTASGTTPSEVATDPPTKSDFVFEMPTSSASPTSASPEASPPTISQSPTVFVIPPTSSLMPVTLSPNNIDTITRSIEAVSDISDTGSGQYAALQWVLNDTVYSSDLEVYQRYALMTLYYSTKGDSWKDNTKWGKSVSECYWFGIECNGGNVTKLALRKCSLHLMFIF